MINEETFESAEQFEKLKNAIPIFETELGTRWYFMRDDDDHIYYFGRDSKGELIHRQFDSYQILFSKRGKYTFFL